MFSSIWGLCLFALPLLDSDLHSGLDGVTGMKSILESLNPRTVWVGRDLKVHLVPWAGTPPSRQSPLPTGFEAQMAGNCMTAPPLGLSPPAAGAGGGGQVESTGS